MLGNPADGEALAPKGAQSICEGLQAGASVGLVLCSQNPSVGAQHGSSRLFGGKRRLGALRRHHPLVFGDGGEDVQGEAGRLGIILRKEPRALGHELGDEALDDLISLVGHPDLRMEMLVDIQELDPLPVGHRIIPAVRYVYFLRAMGAPRKIYIGVTDNLRKRFQQHRRNYGELEILGAMRWRNIGADELGYFEGKGILGWGSGRGGTGQIAEKLIHDHFQRERIDKRKSQPWGKRHEWFRPSRRLIDFISKHSVSIETVEDSPIHELDWRICRTTQGDEAGCDDGSLAPPSKLDRFIPFYFQLPNYLIDPIRTPRGAVVLDGR